MAQSDIKMAELARLSERRAMLSTPLPRELFDREIGEQFGTVETLRRLRIISRAEAESLIIETRAAAAIAPDRMPDAAPSLENGATVLFQVDQVNYGEGEVISYDPETETVTVKDCDGEEWKGPVDQVTVIRGAAK